ncbi:MAG TPA: hypothetical protein VGS80_11920 [Ktedonobacterales bacterium]|nr:hypothetical protein [Ktedonobacterales bacterium]
MTTATTTLAQPVQATVRARLPLRAATVWLTLLAALLIISRRPDAIADPQFFAEDGRTFYQQAYTLGGWQALWMPYAGYLLLVPRLVAWVSLLVPLRWAPLVFTLAAIAIQMAPVAYWLSDRCSACVPDRRVRVLLAVFWIALPLSWEITIRLYNAEWHLNVLAFLVVVAASPARTWRAAAVDAVLVGLAAFTSPLAALLLPLGLVRWWREGRLKPKWDAWQVPLAVLALGVLTEDAVYVLARRSTRVNAPIGATPDRLARIAVNHVVLPDLIGGRLTIVFAPVLEARVPLLIAAVVACGVLPLIAALWRGPLPLRLLILYGLAIATLAMIFPTTDGHTPAGVWLASPVESARYFAVLQLAWLIALLWLTVARGGGASVRRRIGVALLAVTLLVAIPLDWRTPADPDLHFATYATRFAHLPPGESIAIPINPRASNGLDWTLHLTRR